MSTYKLKGLHITGKTPREHIVSFGEMGTVPMTTIKSRIKKLKNCLGCQVYIRLNKKWCAVCSDKRRMRMII